MITKSNVNDPLASAACRQAWRIAWLTELLLTGHSRAEVRDYMLLDKPTFDAVLGAAVTKASREASRTSGLTGLLLRGYSWKQVRGLMLLDKPEFDEMLFAAVNKAKGEAEQALKECVAIQNREEDKSPD